MRPSQEILRGEFIGLDATVYSPAMSGAIRGRIVDETRNMIRLEKAGKEWMVPKKGSKIALRTSGGEVEILGDWILGSPADRIKRKLRRSIG